VAHDSAHVEAWGSAHVEAYYSAHVVARDNAQVWAYDSAHVEAYDSAHVEAWGSAHVEAYDETVVRLMSCSASVTLHGFSVCFNKSKGNVINKSKVTSGEIVSIKPKTTEEWVEVEGVNNDEADQDHVVLYKKVSADFKTQERTPNETLWSVGSTLEHPNWNPESGECGKGKFHACSIPHFCDEFRSEKGDKYVAVKVNVKDMYVWPNAEYPHKVAFRKGKVMYECDRMGKRI
jgi:hypothetical protein